MKYYRFKTEEEFKASDRWNKSLNMPYNWCEDEMFQLGQKVINPKDNADLNRQGMAHCRIDGRLYVLSEFTEITGVEMAMEKSAFELHEVKEIQI